MSKRSILSSIVKNLIAEIGVENVVGIARTPEKAEHLGIEVRKEDYNNRQDFESALVGINAVQKTLSLREPYSIHCSSYLIKKIN